MKPLKGQHCCLVCHRLIKLISLSDSVPSPFLFASSPHSKYERAHTHTHTLQHLVPCSFYWSFTASAAAAAAWMRSLSPQKGGGGGWRERKERTGWHSSRSFLQPDCVWRSKEEKENGQGTHDRVMKRSSRHDGTTTVLDHPHERADGSFIFRRGVQDEMGARQRAKTHRRRKGGGSMIENERPPRKEGRRKRRIRRRRKRRRGRRRRGRQANRFRSFYSLHDDDDEDAVW